MQKSNISIMDESVASVDSDYSDIIQQKDDIIEKLLAVVDDFEAKGREMDDLEMKIRAEVCQEYSEYSDQLLENTRIMCEEEKETIKQIYVKRLEKQEKMYEDIIQRYKDQLSVYEDESLISEKSIDASKSLQDLDISSRSAVSPEKTESKVTKCKESVENKEFTIHELEAEIETYKEELENLKKSYKALEIQIGDVEAEKLSLNKANLDLNQKQEQNMKDMKNLQEDLQIAEEQNQLLKNNISDKENIIKELEEKLLIVQDEVKEKNTLIKDLKSNIMNYKKEMEEFSNYRILCKADTEKLKAQIFALEQDLQTANKNTDTIRKELNLRETVTKNLDKEIETHKEELENLKNSYKTLEMQKGDVEAEKLSLNKVNLDLNQKQELNMKDMKNLQEDLQLAKQQNQLLESKSSENEKNIEELEKKLLTIQDELENAKNNISEKNTLIKDLKSKMDNYCNELEKMKTDFEKLETEKVNLEAKENSYKINIKEIKEKLSSKDREYDVEKLKENLLAVEKEKIKLANNVSDNEKNIKSLEDKLLGLQLELKMEKEKKMEINTTIESLKSKIQISDTELSETHQKLLANQKEYEQVIEELKQTVHLAEEEKKCAMVTISDNEKEIRELNESLSVANMKKNDDEEKDVIINDLKSRIQSSDTELSETHQKLLAIQKKYKQEIEELKQIVRLAEEEKQCAIVTISDNEKKLRELEESLSVTNMKKNDDQEKDVIINDLRSNIDTCKGELENLKNINKQLEIGKGDLKAEKLSLEEANLQLDKKSEEYMKGIKRLEEDLQKAEKQNELLTGTIFEKEKIIQEFENKLLVVNAELKKVENVSEKDTLIKDLKTNNDTYKGELENLKNINKQLEIGKGDLKAEKLSLEEANLQLNKKSEEYMKGIKRLEEDLQKAEKQNELLTGTISEKEKIIQELENKLLTVNAELKKVENVSEKDTLIKDLKTNIDIYKGELEKLKDIIKQLEIGKGNLKAEKLSLEEANLQLNKKSEEYMKGIKRLEEDLQKTEKEKELLTGTISEKEKIIQEFENKLLVVNAELKKVENVSEKDTLIKDLKTKNDTYNSELENLKNSYDNLKIKIGDLEAEKLSLNKAILDLNQKQEQSMKDMKNLEGDLQIVKERNQLLESDIYDKENIIKELEKKLLKVQDQLENAERDVSEKNTVIKNLKSRIANDLEKVKMYCKQLETEKLSLEAKEKSYKTKIKEIEESHASEVNENIENLKQNLLAIEKEKKKLTNDVLQKEKKIKSIEGLLLDLQHELKTEKENVHHRDATVENLKSSLKETEMKLKDSQKLWNETLMSEKEQHEVEIKETLKMKHDLQEENELLKKENLKLKESKLEEEKDIAVTKTKAIPKRAASLKDMENPTEKTGNKGLKKNYSTRSLQVRQTKFKDIFSDIESDAELEIPKPRSRKRVSDEDFDPVKERASKRAKPVETKIPLRKAKQKLQSEKTETLSPIQKAASAVSSRVRAIASNVTAKISSPRLTRGRRKLYNPDGPSTSNDKVTTRRK